MGLKITFWLVVIPLSVAALVSDDRVDAQKTGSIPGPEEKANLAERLPSEGHVLDVVEGTRERFDQSRSLIAGLTVNDALARLAETFVGRPYVAMSLDGTDPEPLRLDLNRFDCMLFIEQLLALVLSESFDQFADRTRTLRYRDGDVSYCKRQHYFHDWVQSAQRQNVLMSGIDWPGEITRSLPLNFMSTNRKLYRPLQSQVRFDCIRQREDGRLVVQRYVPLDAIEMMLPSVQSGDLFAIATDVQGLDVSHTGILVREGSRVDAIHAAPGRGVMRSRSFGRYLRSIPDAIGAVIVRPVDPKNMTQEQPGI